MFYTYNPIYIEDDRRYPSFFVKRTRVVESKR